MMNKYKMSLLCISIGIIINLINIIFMIVTEDITYFNYFIPIGVMLFIIGIIFAILYALEEKEEKKK